MLFARRDDLLWGGGKMNLSAILRWAACGLLLASATLLAAGSSAAAPTGQAKTKDLRVDKAIEEIEGYSVKAGAAPESVEEVYGRSQGAIARLGRAGPSAIPRIRGVLSDPSKDWKVKAMMCEALGKINVAESASALSAVLSDSGQNEFVRATAGHALASMGRKDAEDVIKKTVSDPGVPLRVRQRTMMAVGQVGLDDVAWLKNAALGDGLGLPADKKHTSIRQEEFGLILNAQRALGASKNPQALDALIGLADQHPSNPIFIEMLGLKNDLRAVPVIIKALKHAPTVSVSNTKAAEVLGNMRAVEAVDDLIAVMKESPDPILVSFVCEALAKIGDKKALPPMEDLVANMRTDRRFNNPPGAYWKQERNQSGPIWFIERSLDDLKK